MLSFCYICIIMKMFHRGSRCKTLLAAILLLVSCAVTQAQVTLVMQDTTDYLPYPDGLNTNLAIAASKGYVNEIHRLIRKGADVNAIDYIGASPIIYAVANMQDASVTALLSYHAKTDFLTNESESPLHIAAKLGLAGIAEILIRSDADINIRDRYGCTPLHYAAAYDYITTTDVLIYYGAAIDNTDNQGTTPLMAAVWAGSALATDLLLQSGSNPSLSDSKGFTPLMVAAQNADTLLTRLLLDYGAEISSVNSYNYDVAAMAARTGDTDYTEFLLNSTSWKESRNKNAINPVSVAREYGRTSLFNLYKKYGIKGKRGLNISMATLSLYSRMSWNDIYTGGSISLVEPLYSLKLNIGFDMKPKWTRVLVNPDEGNFIQYMDKRYLFTAGVGREFVFSENLFSGKLALTPNLNGGYLIGSTYPGTYHKPASRFVFVPSVMVERTAENFRIGGGYEYMDANLYRPGPGWFKLELSYNVKFSGNSGRLKNIYWY